MGSELYHYGVKGMRWGRRKAPVSKAKAKRPVNKKKAALIVGGVLAAAGAVTVGAVLYNKHKNALFASQIQQSFKAHQGMTMMELMLSSPEPKSAPKPKIKKPIPKKNQMGFAVKNSGSISKLGYGLAKARLRDAQAKRKYERQRNANAKR